MKTNLEIIVTANVEMKNVAKVLRDANREFTSLSSVLRFMQDATNAPEMAHNYLQMLAELGIPTEETVTPRVIMDSLDESQFVEVTTGRGKDKRTQKMAGIWSNVQKRDEEGNKIFDETGAPVLEQVCRPVKSWTPTKLARLLAQAVAFYDARHQDDIDETDEEAA